MREFRHLPSRPSIVVRYFKDLKPIKWSWDLKVCKFYKIGSSESNLIVIQFNMLQLTLKVNCHTNRRFVCVQLVTYRVGRL